MKRPRRYKGLKDCYRLDRLLPVSQKNGKTLGFETEHFAATEDIKRGKRLRRAKGKDPAALRLIRGLEGAGTPETMASARYMREERLDFAAIHAAIKLDVVCQPNWTSHDRRTGGPASGAGRPGEPPARIYFRGAVSRRMDSPLS